jgi:hypothetical protein
MSGNLDNWELVWDNYLANNAAPTFATATFVSGTAQQNAAAVSAKYFIGITGGSAGTVKVDIGPTSAVADNLIPATAANAVASQTLVIDVPAGWYIKVTVVTATIVAFSVVATGL